MVNVNIERIVNSMLHCNVQVDEEVINSVEFYQLNELKLTMTEGFDNIIYNIEDATNDLVIKVNYDTDMIFEKTVILSKEKCKIWLYKTGNECESITGGFMNVSNCTIERFDDYIKFNGNAANGQSYIASTNTFNVDDCDFMYVDVKTITGYQCNPNFGLGTGRSSYVVSLNVSGSNMVHEIDVSKATGNVYFVHNRPFSYTTSYTRSEVSNMYLTANIVDIQYTEGDVVINISEKNTAVEFKSVTVCLDDEVYKVYTENMTAINFFDDKCKLGPRKVTVYVDYVQSGINAVCIKNFIGFVNNENIKSVMTGTKNYKITIHNLQETDTITKVEVKTNNYLTNIFDTVAESYDITIDEGILGMGYNTINVLLYLKDAEENETIINKRFLHDHKVNPLVSKSSPQEIIDRVGLINTTREVEKINLVNIINDASMSLPYDMKMRDVINTVGLLLKDISSDSNEFINRITVLENQLNSNITGLKNMLTEKGITYPGDATYEELLELVSVYVPQTLVLYDYGYVNTDVVGTFNGVYDGNVTGSANVTMNEDHMLVSTTTAYTSNSTVATWSGVRSENTIDTTNYKAIHVEYEPTNILGSLYMGMDANTQIRVQYNTSVDYYSGTSKDLPNGHKVITCTFTPGNFYFLSFIYSDLDNVTRTYKIYKIWMDSIIE